MSLVSFSSASIVDHVRSLLGAHHVFVQRYLPTTGKWQSLPIDLPSQDAYDTAVAPLPPEPEVSGELTGIVGQQLRQFELVQFKIVTTIGPVQIKGDCLLVPIGVDRIDVDRLGIDQTVGERILWGRLCIIGDREVWQPRDLEWLKAIALLLGEAMVVPLPLLPPLRVDTTSHHSEEIEHLQQQIADLAASDRAKDEFISKISHDLRAPLMNMRMALKMLQITAQQNPEVAQVFSSDRVANYLQILQAECIREIALINTVLDLQRLEAGTIHLRPTAIDLAAWLPKQMASFESVAQSHQQTLTLNLPPAQQLTITSDDTCLTRILTELLHNACKYTVSGGEIACEVEYPPSYAHQMPVYITVSNPAELAAADLAQIFDRFYRVPGTDHHRQGGTGLGLFLVRNLVQQIQGQITVQSSGGQTVFTVAIPLNLSPSASQGAPGDPQLVAEL